MGEWLYVVCEPEQHSLKCSRVLVVCCAGLMCWGEDVFKVTCSCVAGRRIVMGTLATT